MVRGLLLMACLQENLNKYTYHASSYFVSYLHVFSHMTILLECIKEYTNELIKARRRQLDFINDNYNIKFAINKQKDIFKLIDEINQLNKAIRNIEENLKTIEEIETNNMK